MLKITKLLNISAFEKNKNYDKIIKFDIGNSDSEKLINKLKKMSKSKKIF